MPPLLALVSLEKGSPAPPAIPSPNSRAFSCLFLLSPSVFFRPIRSVAGRARAARNNFPARCTHMCVYISASSCRQGLPEKEGN